MEKSVVAALELPAFDLSYVIEQLSHKPEYSGWTPERFAIAEKEYRRFLVLCKMYPDQPIIPGRDVDSIWHRHILNTKRYMMDSQNYFGYYLHHSPHSRIEAGSTRANDNWLNTLYLYEKVFCEKPADGWLSGMAICNGGCDGAKCGPGVDSLPATDEDYHGLFTRA
jgi:hypothetical protein